MMSSDRSRRSLRSRTLGFTLIELVVTLALLGLMAALAAPMAEVAVQRSKEQDLRVALREIRTAIDRYKRAVDQGQVTRTLGGSGYPATLEQLVAGVPNQLDPKGGRLYFLRRLPRDPFAAESAQGSQGGWGLRSYASAPDDPQEGEDVFDVYSRSTDIGLNGVPHREW